MMHFVLSPLNIIILIIMTSSALQAFEEATPMDLVGIEPYAFPRIREVYVRKTAPQVVVRTRTGGGNRDTYNDAIEACCNLPNFAHERDCSWDSTYMKFYYNIDEKYYEGWKAWIAKQTADPET